MNGGRGHVRIVAAVSCALIVGAAAAGCTPEPTTPSPTPTVIASPRPTPTPTPTPTPDAAVKPQRPAAMDEASAAGAEAAAVYFLQLFPYVFATGDLDEWRELSHPECVFCASVVDGVDDMVGAGQHTEGGVVEVASVTSIETDPGRWVLVSYTLAEAPSSRRDGTGLIVEEFDAKDYRMDVAVIWEDSGWIIRELTHTLVT